MAIDIATLGVKVDASGAITGLNTVESGLSRVTKAAAALGITLGAGALFSKMVRETIDAQYAMAQLEARVKSTGMAAGFTAPQLAAMASEMQGLTTYSDEAVMGAQSLLLTFTKIRGDTLPAATLAVANLATAMGGDLKGAALQVGKALQDPEQGLTALRRSGVSFTDAQSDVIKALFATGQQAAAQKMILKELEVEFGGAAAAARDTLGGALEGLKNSFGELFESNRKSTGGLVEWINAASDALKHTEELKGAMVGLAGALGAVMVAVKGPAFIAFMATLANPATIVSIAALATLGVIFGTAATNAALAARDTREYLETLDAMSSAALRSKIEGIRDAMKEVGIPVAKWIELQEKLDATEQALARELAAHTGAIKEYTKSAYEQALADERAARAKELLNAQVKAALDLEEKLARGVRFDLPKTVPMQAASIGSAPASIGDPTGSLVASAAKMQDTITRTSLAESAKRAVGEVAAWFAANKEMEQIRENFLRGTQEAFAKTFEDIFSKGIKSFGDLFARLGDLVKQAAAQMAASGIMKFLTSNFNLGKAGANGGAGGILGGIGAVIKEIPAVGWIAGAVAGIAGLFQSHHKAAEAAKRQAEENRRLAIEQQKAAEAARVQAEAERAKAAVEQAWNVARAEDDLKVRDLKLRGLADEAEAQSLWNQQVAEFKAAVDQVNAGKLSEEFLKELSAIQERERNALAASQAAAKAAKQAEDAERALTAAREKAAAQLSAFQDLEVEMAFAKAKTGDEKAKAEQMAFDLEQQRRLEEAQKNQTAEYIAKLKELQELQRQNRAASLTAPPATDAPSTASSVFAGADTVTSSFGTKVSAEVGDRMLDNLVSIRVILRAIEANTRNLGGKINTSLGLSLADQYSLSGSAVLS